MSRSFSIAPFILNVYTQDSPEALSLDTLNSGTSFYTIFQDYLKTRTHEYYHDGKRQAMLKIDQYEFDKTHSTWGRFLKGDYGYQATLENVETGETRLRNTQDCEFLPFFFFLKLKRGQKQGILLLQRSGNMNLRGILQKDLETFLKSKINESLKIDIQPLVSPEYIKKILGSEVKEIAYIKYRVPTDIADDCGLEDNYEDLGYLNVIIQMKRGHRIALPEWAMNLLSGKKLASEFITIKNVPYDEVKIKIDVGGKEKTICLSPESQPTMNIDISPEIGNDGHPTIASMLEIAQRLIPEFSKALGWKNA